MGSSMPGIRRGRRECTISADFYLDESPQTQSILRDGFGKQFLVDIFFGSYRFCAKAVLGDMRMHASLRHALSATVEFMVVGEPVYQHASIPVVLMVRQQKDSFLQAAMAKMRDDITAACAIPSGLISTDPLPIVGGGTGATSLDDARRNLSSTPTWGPSPVQEIMDLILAGEHKAASTHLERGLPFEHTIRAVAERYADRIPDLAEEQPMSTAVFQFTAVHTPKGDSPEVLTFGDEGKVVTVAVDSGAGCPHEAVKRKAVRMLVEQHRDVPDEEVEILVRPFDD